LKSQPGSAFLCGQKAHCRPVDIKLIINKLNIHTEVEIARAGKRGKITGAGEVEGESRLGRVDDEAGLPFGSA
jgi:hypothetical protein